MTNVVLLTVDALRADHVSTYGYTRETTPFLDELASESVLFENAYSPSSHTREAVPALLTGQYPHRAVDDNYRLNSESIASRLVDTHTTGAFHSNPFVSRAYGFDEGFDKFDDDLYLSRHRLVALAQRFWDKLRHRHYARAESINGRALIWLDSLEDEPFFLWNHYMDPHSPYCPPPGYEDRYPEVITSNKRAQDLYERACTGPGTISNTERRCLVDSYDAELQYLDDSFARFFDALETRGLLEETLVIVTADHGDAFGEEGMYGHPRSPLDTLLDVPFLIRSPEMKPDRVKSAVSTLDIVPTILSMLGRPDDSLPGVPQSGRAECNENRIVVSEIRDDEQEELVWRLRATTTTESQTIEVPANDLAMISLSGDDRLSRRLQAHIDRMSGEGTEEKGNVTTPKEVADRLDALGYR
jgi:arylsulfatase